MSEPGNVCDCCGGDMPGDEAWEANRDHAGDCDGSVDSRTGRCRAWRDDRLWIVDPNAPYGDEGE